MSSVKTATARARVRPAIKEKAEHIIHDLGLSVSAAFELYYRQIILNNGLPFDVRIPNATTRKAIEEARKGRGKKFDTAKALFDDLDI
jgi:DNA-damage-inducible protein J